MYPIIRSFQASLNNLLQNDVLHFAGSGPPTDGTTGANILGPGSTYYDTTAKILYRNVGTKASPTWVGEGITAVTVTSAELLALRATPKTLVAAPGAGRMLEFVAAVVIADNGTAYVVGTNDLAIRYKDGTGDIISQTIDTAGLLDSTNDIVTQAMPLATDSKSPKADVENQPLVLHNIGAAELTTGTGVLRVRTKYRVHVTGW